MMLFSFKKKNPDQGGEGGLSLKTKEKNMQRADSNLESGFKTDTLYFKTISPALCAIYLIENWG